MRCGHPNYPWGNCDGDYNTSPDWRGGDTWYRMMPPAGSFYTIQVQTGEVEISGTE